MSPLTVLERVTDAPMALMVVLAPKMIPPAAAKIILPTGPGVWLIVIVVPAKVRSVPVSVAVFVNVAPPCVAFGGTANTLAPV